MFTVYALHSQKFDKIYIGMTSDVEKRLFAHNNLPKGWTAKFRPWQLVHSEHFDTKSKALEREKQLKTAKEGEFVWDIVHKI